VASALAAWRDIKAAANAAVITHGGTITHHHAVGRDHRSGYEREADPLFRRVLAAAKRELDPQAVLNPGVLFDPLGRVGGHHRGARNVAKNLNAGSMIGTSPHPRQKGKSPCPSPSPSIWAMSSKSRAKAAEVFAVLADVPRSVSHFPKVHQLKDLGDGVYQWDMEKVGTEHINIHTVYASKYVSNKAKGPGGVDAGAGASATRSWAARGRSRTTRSPPTSSSTSTPRCMCRCRT
jgi:hypothetical protein